jgi:hypothetical protein
MGKALLHQNPCTGTALGFCDWIRRLLRGADSGPADTVLRSSTAEQRNELAPI